MIDAKNKRNNSHIRLTLTGKSFYMREVTLIEHLGLITIPAYFKQFVNSDINLAETPKLRCPFHKEEQGQSFSYSQETKFETTTPPATLEKGTTKLTVL